MIQKTLTTNVFKTSMLAFDVNIDGQHRCLVSMSQHYLERHRSPSHSGRVGVNPTASKSCVFGGASYRFE